MPLKKIILITCIFLILSTFLGFAQTAEDADRLFNEGLKLFKQYMYEKAIEKFIASAEIFEKLGINRKKDLGYDYQFIANCYYYLSRFDKALEYYEQALAIFEEVGKKDIVVVLLNGIGFVYDAWGQYDKAIEYYQKALAIAEKLGRKRNIAILLNNIGNVYHSWGQYDKAIEYYQKALAIDEELGRKGDIARDLNNIGSVYEDWVQYDKALEYN